MANHWAMQLGDTAPNFDFLTPSKYLPGGFVEAHRNYGPDPEHGYFARYTKDGAVDLSMRVQHYSLSGYDIKESVACDDPFGNMYYTCAANATSAANPLAKVNKAGVLVFDKRAPLGFSAYEPIHIEYDTAENCLVLFFEATFDSVVRYVVQKLDPDTAATIAERSYDFPFNAGQTRVKQLSGGGWLLNAGSSLLKLDASLNPTARRAYALGTTTNHQIYGITELPDGSFAICGRVTISTSFYLSYARISADLATVSYAARYNVASTLGTAIVSDASHIYLCGDFGTTLNSIGYIKFRISDNGIEYVRKLCATADPRDGDWEHAHIVNGGLLVASARISPSFVMMVNVPKDGGGLGTFGDIEHTETTLTMTALTGSTTTSAATSVTFSDFPWRVDSIYNDFYVAGFKLGRG
jgi:hypothetical protein